MLKIYEELKTRKQDLEWRCFFTDNNKYLRRVYVGEFLWAD